MPRKPINLHEILAQVRGWTKPIPVLRSLSYELGPRYFDGSVLENKLGYQIARTVAGEVGHALRPKRSDRSVAEYVDTIERDGAVMIPSFLSDEDFASVRAEYDAALPTLAFQPEPPQPNPTRVESIQQNINREHAARFPAMTRCLRQNETIARVAEGVTRRTVRYWPPALIYVHRLHDGSLPEADIQTVLHSDLHKSTVKAWLYLNDIDASNGAMRYAKGSHKLSLPRLRHEYDISVRRAIRRRDGDRALDPALLAQRGIHTRDVVSPEAIAEMGLREEPLVGKANTLIIADTRGFHRRGEFTCDRPRETVIVNFRHLEAWRQGTYSELFRG